MLLPMAVLDAETKAPEVEYARLARDFADAMLLHGTDRYGSQHTPQFASLLSRTDRPRLLPNPIYLEKSQLGNLPNVLIGNNRPHKITYRGGDVGSDAGLYQLLYALSNSTGQAKYAQAADASLSWFLRHCPIQETGLLPWGEHTGWDFRREQFDDGFDYSGKHEFQQWWPLFDRFVLLQPLSLAGEPTVVEKFSDALWRGHVGRDSEGRLVYGRHASLFSPQRPNTDLWNEYGMFPRHGGCFIATWSAAHAASDNRTFKERTLKHLREFIEGLHDQIDRRGFVIYSFRRILKFSIRQSLKMAREVDASADLLESEQPDLAVRMRELAQRIDASVMRLEALGGLNPATPLLLFERWIANRRAKATQREDFFRKAFFRAVDELCALEQLPERSLGKYSEESPTRPGINVPGRIPEQYAVVIEVLLAASRESVSEDRVQYLRKADYFARQAVELFLDDGHPLPKSLDRQPVLLDGSEFPHFYHSYLGGDDLMLALLKLSQQTP